MDNPLIQVIIPVYNTEKYLSKCIESVLRQSYQNIELILVNDASTDNSEEIILAYKKQHENIYYLKHEKNGGLFAARLTGIRHCLADRASLDPFTPPHIVY